MKRLALILALMASPVAAQQCGPHVDVSATLAERYGEKLMVRAMDRRGLLMEVYVSESGGFTVLMVRPDGVACLAQHGVRFVLIPQGDPA